MESERTPPEVPKRIKQAANLIYLSLAIGLVKSILYETMTSQKMLTDPRALAIGIIVIIILGFFGFKIGQGKNWARMTLLVLLILGMILYPFIVLEEFGKSPIIGIVSVAQMLLQVYVLIILFTGESKEWFINQRG